MSNNGLPILPAGFVNEMAKKDYMLAQVYIKQFDDLQCRINPLTRVLETRRRPGDALPKKGSWHRPTFEQFKLLTGQMIKNGLKDDGQPLG